MSYDFKSEREVKEFIHNLAIEYRFGCYSEKKPEVCHLLGDYLEAIKKDYEKAGRLYRTNCDEYKYAKSCQKYGVYAMLGKGGVKEDFPVGLSYFAKACELNEAEGCYNQAMLLITNNQAKGVEQNVSKGMELLRKACEKQHANACYFLSGMYIAGVRRTPKVDAKDDAKTKTGEFLITPDMHAAHTFAAQGCHLGNIYSCVNLSQMYAKGDGVDRNPELADKYKKMALEMQEEVESSKTLTFQEGLK